MPTTPGREAPSVVVLAGPNGAGKSTAAPSLLKGRLAVDQFVNADEIARGLAGFAPETAAIPAGRIMLARLKELAAARANFAFETTLASRSLTPWIESLTASGYRFHLVFLWLPSADLAVARVRDRVRQGGHDVPETTIRRRYRSGLANFWRLYRSITTTWRVYNSSDGRPLRLVARGRGARVDQVRDAETWRQVEREKDP